MLRVRVSAIRRAGRTVYIGLDHLADGDAVKVVSGSASVALARGLANALGAGFVDVAYEKHPGGFPDGERYVRVLGGITGDHVVLVGATHPDSKIVELLLLVDAVRKVGAERVSLLIPYFGYGRQDKRFESGEALSAEVLARHLEVGVDEVLTMGLHNPDILKFFNVPTREVSGMPAVGRYLQGRDIDFILAPDDNAIRHVKEAASIAGKPFDHLDKERIDSYTVTRTHRRGRRRARRSSRTS